MSRNVDHHVAGTGFPCCSSNQHLFSVTSALRDMYNGDEEMEAFDEVQTIRRDRPDRFQMYLGKECWQKGVEVDNHIDVLMHLLYLGLTRTVLDTVHEFLSKKKLLTTFLDRVQGRLESIDALGLHWARLQGYRKGSFGGWISENYLDFSRVMAWFFDDMTDLLAEPAFCEPRVKEQKHWTKVENEGWLSCRGLPTNGKADELRERVKGYMQQRGGPPRRLPEIDLHERDMIALIETYRDVVETSMTREVTPAIIELFSMRIKVRMQIKIPVCCKNMLGPSDHLEDFLKLFQ